MGSRLEVIGCSLIEVLSLYTGLFEMIVGILGLHLQM